MIPVQQPAFVIPAGGSFPLICDGRYFRIQSATGPLKVVGDSFGNMGSVGVGQGLHLKATDDAFHRLTFIDTSGGPNTVTVVIADADFVDNSLLGTVSVVDGEKARTLAGGMFAGAPVQAAAAGAYGWVQLWNPAGTGKNLIVTAVEFTGNGVVASNIVAYIAAVAKANVYAFGPINKKGGGPAPVAQLRYESNVVQDTFAAGIARNVNLPVSGTDTWNIKGALVIPPSFGLTVNNNVQNATFGMNVEWFEESQ